MSCPFNKERYTKVELLEKQDEKQDEKQKTSNYNIPIILFSISIIGLLTFAYFKVK